jgi:hypothetical protein
MIELVSTWTCGASQFIGECFDGARPFIDQNYDGLDPYLRFVSAQLFIDCQLTSESVLILVREGKEWDADLVNRSLMEGSIKYVYMLLGDAPEMVRKAREYWEILPRFAAIRRSDRVKRFIREIPGAGSLQWRPFHDLVLSDQEVEVARQGMNRKQRAALEETWSFFGITRQFLATGDEALGLLVHLAHGYGTSSHLIHKDGDGVAMVWERYRRESADRTSVRLAHAARVVSDVCAFAKIRLLRLLVACHADTASVHEVEERYRWLTCELDRAYVQFSKTEYGGESAADT